MIEHVKLPQAVSQTHEDQHLQLQGPAGAACPADSIAKKPMNMHAAASAANFAMT
jgi:hypothetical protein